MTRCIYIDNDGLRCARAAFDKEGLCTKHGRKPGSGGEAIANAISAYGGAALVIMKIVEEVIKIAGPHLRVQSERAVNRNFDLNETIERCAFVMRLASDSLDQDTLDAIEAIYDVLETEVTLIVQGLAVGMKSANSTAERAQITEKS